MSNKISMVKVGDRVRLLNDRLGQTGVVYSVTKEDGRMFPDSPPLFVARLTVDQTGENCVGCSEKEGDFSHLMEVISGVSPVEGTKNDV